MTCTDAFATKSCLICTASHASVGLEAVGRADNSAYAVLQVAFRKMSEFVDRLEGMFPREAAQGDSSRILAET